MAFLGRKLKIENFAQTLKGGRVIKMLFLECNFILRKSNAVVFRLLTQNHAITMYVYDQSRNEDFGKKKRFWADETLKISISLICCMNFFNFNFSLKFRICKVWLHSSHFALTVKWVFLTHGLRSNFLCVTVYDFYNVKLYRGYVKKNKKFPITAMTAPEISYMVN